MPIRPIDMNAVDAFLDQHKHAADFCKEFRRLWDAYPNGVVGSDHPYVQFTIQQVTKPFSSITRDEEALYNAYKNFAIVLPIRPYARKGRILQQASRFTLDMPFIELRDGGIRYFEQDVAKHHIASTNKPRILDELMSVGISEETIFYDLDALSRSFRKTYNIL